jgi:hypothetical protein
MALDLVDEIEGNILSVMADIACDTTATVDARAARGGAAAVSPSRCTNGTIGNLP